MKAKNISNRVIGIADKILLPDEEMELVAGYEHTDSIIGLVNHGDIKLSGRETKKPTNDEVAALKAEENAKAEKEAEELRQQRLASLKDINEEDLAKLADELGINPASCKDQKDVLKKVKKALEK